MPTEGGLGWGDERHYILANPIAKIATIFIPDMRYTLSDKVMSPVETFKVWQTLKVLLELWTSIIKRI